MGFMDNYQCSECRDVEHMRGKRRGSFRRHGDHVGVLSPELSEWLACVDQDKCIAFDFRQIVTLMAKIFIFRFFLLNLQ
mgnify:FL=1